MLTKEIARPPKEKVRPFSSNRHDETTTPGSRKTCLALKVSRTDPEKLTCARGIAYSVAKLKMLEAPLGPRGVSAVAAIDWLR